MKLLFSNLLLAFAFGVATMTVAGYSMHVARLANWIDGAPPMAINTALCIVALAVSAWLRRCEHEDKKKP